MGKNPSQCVGHFFYYMDGMFTVRWGSKEGWKLEEGITKHLFNAIFVR